MRIIEELMEIWPNEVCDRSSKRTREVRQRGQIER